MTYITLAPDNQLLVTKSSTIYRGDNMNTSITFLIPTRVDNIDLETATVLLSSIRADGEPDMVILNRSPEKYGENHYRYVLPVTCKLSRYPGRVCMWLQICDGDPCHPIVAKSGECVITIHESKSLDDCLGDHHISALYQLKLKIDEMVNGSSGSGNSGNTGSNGGSEDATPNNPDGEEGFPAIEF